MATYTCVLGGRSFRVLLGEGGVFTAGMMGNVMTSASYWEANRDEGKEAGIQKHREGRE